MGTYLVLLFCIKLLNCKVIEILCSVEEEQKMGRQKKVTCGKCLRIMRSDYLKIHMLQHEKGNYQNESFCSSSITTSKPTLQEETESEFSLVSTNTYEVSTLQREEMIKRLIKDDGAYKYNIARGKHIYEEVNKYGIKEESLCQEYRELLKV